MKTSSGFEYELSEERLDNYELVEAIAEIDENPFAITKVVKLLLSEEETKRLKDHVRTESGTVPVKALTDEITEMFQSQSETKNS